MDVINIDARATLHYGRSLLAQRRQVGESVKEATQFTRFPRIGLQSHRLLPFSAGARLLVREAHFHGRTPDYDSGAPAIPIYQKYALITLASRVARRAS